MDEFTYYEDEFYDIKGDTDTIRGLMVMAKDLSYNWRVDILDCEKDMSRRKIEMWFHDILGKLTKDSHVVFIHRRGVLGRNKWHLEIGFCTLDSPSYFLFIYCNESHLDEFKKVFSLEQKH